MSARDDDGSEIVALARKMGLAGISPGPSTPATPPAAQTSTKSDADGADVVALARKYGVVGLKGPDQ